MKRNSEIFRECIVTRKKISRINLIRIVKTKKNEIKVDVTNKIPGRGIYIIAEWKIFQELKSKRLLEKKLKVNHLELIYQELESIITNRK